MPEATLTQPENPNQESGQSVSYERETVVTVPTQSEVKTETVREDGSKVTIIETFPAGTQRRETVRQGVQQNVSGSWKDTAREMGAKLASMRPVQIAGILALLGAAAMFHPAVRLAIGGGKTVQIATGAIGLLLIFGPVLIVGQEKLLLVLGLLGAVAAWFISRLSHKEGQLDAKNETKTTTNP